MWNAGGENRHVRDLDATDSRLFDLIGIAGRGKRAQSDDVGTALRTDYRSAASMALTPWV